MDFRLPFHMKLAKGRQISIWGTGRAAPEIYDQIMDYNNTKTAFFVSAQYGQISEFCGLPVKNKLDLSPLKHYVIIGSSIYHKEIEQELTELGFAAGTDYYNPFLFAYSYDIMVSEKQDIFFGKASYYCSPDLEWFILNTISHLGRFSSINASARIEPDHRMSYITTSDINYFANTEVLAKSHYSSSEFGKVHIGNDVWIGAHAFINCSKCHMIGDGAIIGTGAVVLEDVPPYAVVVGMPAKVKKYRFTPEQIDILLKVKWWEWSNEQIYENTELLVNPNLFFERFKNVGDI